MGCATALYAALAQPSMVRALVLVIPPSAWSSRQRVRQKYEDVVNVLREERSTESRSVFVNTFSEQRNTAYRHCVSECSYDKRVCVCCMLPRSCELSLNFSASFSCWRRVFASICNSLLSVAQFRLLSPFASLPTFTLYRFVALLIYDLHFFWFVAMLCGAEA